MKTARKSGPWVTALILAAGKSSRLKRPKQLLPFCGVTLIRHVAQVAIYSQADAVAVVLGAFQLRIRREVQFLDLDAVRCLTWYRGMGATIKSGLNRIQEFAPQTEGFLLMLCDQPLISEEYLDRMIQEFRAGSSKIVASKYSDTIGVPALIHRDYLAELLEIDDKLGAKQFLLAHEHEILALDFAGGDVDIDTPSDLIRLQFPSPQGLLLANQEFKWK